MSNDKDLAHKNKLAELGGGKEKIAKQHALGKLTARERITKLLDPDSFFEIDRFVSPNPLESDPLYGDGVVTGSGKINDLDVYVYSQDFTVHGGSLAPLHAKKIVKVMRLAREAGYPIIGINDSGGARIQEGVSSLAGYADIFLENTLASGVIPQISLVLGPCAGGAVYSPALTDFILASDNAYLFLTGPDVVETVLGESLSKAELGGAKVHASKTGIVSIRTNKDEDCLIAARKLIGYLPSNNLDSPTTEAPAEPQATYQKKLTKVIPTDSSKPYDVKQFILGLTDSSELLELQSEFAQNIIIGFARIDGKSVGIVANQPSVLAGCLDINASKKAARFVRFCDSFNIPIITFVDVPGFLPGKDQEHGGVISEGAKLLHAYATATCPKITLILRKAYGGAYDVMSSKHLRADFNFALPTAEVAVMGAEGAVKILHRKELAAINADQQEQEEQKFIDEYRKQHLSPWEAAAKGYLDAIVEPLDVRSHLTTALDKLKSKRQDIPKKKQGNIPL